MKFCPKCGSIMIVKGEELVCPKCGYKESLNKRESKKLSIKEKVENKDNIKVALEDESAYPISEETVCPKCGKKGAYYFFKQTRSSDEPETKFFKCVHCGYVWREYD
ncbi:MAG: transcription factor S [Nanoarchaeota archaeon]|jgi:DNA-directed RNA polymerase subunit M